MNGYLEYIPIEKKWTLKKIWNVCIGAIDYQLIGIEIGKPIVFQISIHVQISIVSQISIHDRFGNIVFQISIH